MIISHIVAVSKNFVIGQNNQLPWQMPDDAAYFHRVTEGHIVIMGRKNYEANGKALPLRHNIVITRNPDYQLDDAMVVPSVDKALTLAETFHPKEVFIVGGGEIYKYTLDLADRIFITVIDTVAEGDTRYPHIDFEDYTILSETPRKADRKNPFDYTFYILEKK